jgi:DNA-binding NtrC family response regulator
VPLAEFFLHKFVAQNRQSRVKGFSPEATARLLECQWPGNVRSLENAIERAVILGRGALIEPLDLNLPSDKRNEQCEDDNLFAHLLEQRGSDLPSLESMSQSYVAFVLSEVGGVKEKAARLLEIDRKTLYRKLSEMRESSPLHS